MLLIEYLGLEAKLFNGILDFHNEVFVLDKFFNVVQWEKKKKGKTSMFQFGPIMSLARSFFALYKFIHIHFLLLLPAKGAKHILLFGF
ncbi:hypothetical protein RDI58_002355 [Solanum bulbocastanum]|uniref:Uncharacterized protein n=1 Tax=Solanum bulbocastanum TaxID=147425 RepID=A0AAN8YR30_SOLBU